MTRRAYFTPWQGGIICGAIDEPRKSSKAIDKRVIINFHDKNVVIVRFRDKGWLAIAKLKPLSLFISLLSMPKKAFDNVKIEK